ncbi:sulfite exporter TauE/SafE family protein [Streptomyces sp. SAI-041]|uniref:sulfite exporter TauE/SafE family protein n=1 Tax=Streptomyces sp. SAI-041 TaxID=2940548 RepID=UPI00247352B1|nr:sulfite exporter TauE/SafE family protein [Streptomyces sp. SAI-041]MDH6549779.1 putative membrane protein YfcA [Streptomyces sp. SAI-041]
MTATAEVLLAVIVLLGSCVQWLTGMGFALVSVPALVLLLGPEQGVILANCAAGVICLVGLAGGLRLVRPRAMLPFCLAAACTVPAGTWVTHRLPRPWLLLVMGALVTVAVLLVMRGARAAALGGTRGAVLAGAAGGFMNSAAGVGGPPFSLYAVNAGWTVREFVPNAMFYGVIVNAFSVASNGLPGLGRIQWLLVCAAMTTGGLTGRWLTPRIPENRARLLVLLLALTGGITAVGKGLWEL